MLLNKKNKYIIKIIYYNYNQLTYTNKFKFNNHKQYIYIVYFKQICLLSFERSDVLIFNSYFRVNDLLFDEILVNIYLERKPSKLNSPSLFIL